MMNTLETQTRIIAKADWESRLERVEQDTADTRLPRAA
jgi:hypothetical protein